MNVTINVSSNDARSWRYFLRKKYGSRKGLKRLVKLAVLDAVASIAREELDAAKVVVTFTIAQFDELRDLLVGYAILLEDGMSYNFDSASGSKDNDDVIMHQQKRIKAVQQVLEGQ